MSKSPLALDSFKYLQRLVGKINSLPSGSNVHIIRDGVICRQRADVSFSAGNICFPSTQGDFVIAGADAATAFFKGEGKQITAARS